MALNSKEAREEATKLALQSLADNINDEIVVVSDEVEKAVGALTKDPELRWRRISLRRKARCPDCGNVMHGDCGRFQCPVCSEVVIVKSANLLKMCERCISFRTKCEGTAEGTESKPVWSKKIKWRINEKQSQGT